MSTYLHAHPSVAIAIVTASLMILAMVIRSMYYLRFHKALRRQAGDFWATKLRGCSIGMARLSHATPSRIEKMTDELIVLEVCHRFDQALWRLKVAAWVLFGLTAALLIVSGLHS